MRKRTTLLFVVQAIIVMPAARAAIISDHDEHISSITEWDDTLTVDKFDPAQGTLNSVTVTLMAEMMSDLTLDNDNTTAVMANGKADVLLVGDPFPGLGLFVVNPSVETGFLSLAADDSGDMDLPGDGGPDEATTMGLSGNDSTPPTVLLPGDADFGMFLGPGTLSTAISTVSSFTVQGGGGNVDINVNTEAGAELWVEYDFTPQPPGGGAIPEPTTWAIWSLLGLAFAGARCWRRKSH